MPFEVGGMFIYLMRTIRAHVDAPTWLLSMRASMWKVYKDNYDPEE